MLRSLEASLLPLAAALLLVGCQSGDGHDAVGLTEWERVALSTEVSETITVLSVTKGQRVEAGQEIVRLDPRKFEARRALAAEQKAQAQARLAELRRGPRGEEIEEARARVRGDKSDLANAEKEYRRLADLVGRNLASQESADNARTLRDRARSQLEVAEAALELLLAGTTVEELDQAAAQLAQADARLLEAELDLERLTLVAPRDGRIDDLPYYLGERPPAGATLAVMLAGERPYARVYVPEALRARVVPGASATVYVDGLDESVGGRVRYVSSEATFTPYFSLTERDRSRLSYVAEIDLIEAGSEDLPGGVPVRVDFGDVGTGTLADGR